MSIAVVIDMNLSPDWVPVLQGHGWQAVHWSTVGDPRAADQEIIDWALANRHVVFTHDLDFGRALALTLGVRVCFRFAVKTFFLTTWPRSSSRPYGSTRQTWPQVRWLSWKRGNAEFVSCLCRRPGRFPKDGRVFSPKTSPESPRPQ